jgi:hypothetical protein
MQKVTTIGEALRVCWRLDSMKAVAAKLGVGSAEAVRTWIPKRS